MTLNKHPRFLATEFLTLTKMNWNNTQFDGYEPITTRAARQVGKILKYIPKHEPLKATRYSFFMETVVLIEALLRLFTQSDVEALSSSTPKDVNEVRFFGKQWKGWLRGVDPAARDHRSRRAGL